MSTKPEREKLAGRQQKLSSQAMLLKMMSKVSKNGDSNVNPESFTSNLQLATYRSANNQREKNYETKDKNSSVHSR